MIKKKRLTAEDIMNELETHTDILKKYKVRKIGLFGSYVRGEQNAGSDIDFLVDFQEPSFDNFMDLVFFLEDLFNKRVELITENNLSPYMRPYVEKEIRWYDYQAR